MLRANDLKLVHDGRPIVRPDATKGPEMGQLLAQINARDGRLCGVVPRMLLQLPRKFECVRQVHGKPMPICGSYARASGRAASVTMKFISAFTGDGYRCVPRNTVRSCAVT